jgi:hypothetical protein
MLYATKRSGLQVTQGVCARRDGARPALHAGVVPGVVRRVEGAAHPFDSRRAVSGLWHEPSQGQIPEVLMR